MKKPKMAAEWEEETPEGKELPEHVSKHALATVHRVRTAADAKRRAMIRGRVWKGLALGSIGAHLARSVVVARRKEKVSKHAAGATWMAGRRIRELMKLKGAAFQKREIIEWARRMSHRFRLQQLKATGKEKGAMKAMADRWDVVAHQMKDALAKGRLERAGLLAAGVAGTAAAGTAGHEVGKKRERKRVHRVVG